MTRLLAALAALLAGAGCEPGPTQVVITLDAEEAVRADARTLEVVVHGGASASSLEEMPSFAETTPSADAGPGPDGGPHRLRWPRVFALAPRGGDASRVLSFHAVARDVRGRLLVETRLVRGYVAGRVTPARLVLADRCRGIQCDEDERCESGACVPAVAEMSDAGTPAVDAGPVPCTTAADCDDGLPCNGVETCGAEGICAPGTTIVCDDRIACTDDRCHDTGCRSEPDHERCRVGEIAGVCVVEGPAPGCQFPTCTDATCAPGPCEAARCEGDVCVRTPLCGPREECCGSRCVPLGCDDGNACTDDFCNGTECAHAPAPRRCDDGDACTSGDVCQTDGTCSGVRRGCDDGNPCTFDSCDPAGACVFSPLAGPCDDRDPCTFGDECSGGACRGRPAACDDLVACTEDSCSGGMCRNVPNDALCTSGMMGRCLAGGCQYATCTPETCTAGPCETASCLGGATGSCVRASTCSTGQMCCAGTCVAPGCNDGDPCTDDACGPGGCTHVSNTAPCNDGIACTTGDRCSAGVCRGTPLACNDGNPCTDDSCMAGSCRFVANDGRTCDDGQACTTNWCSGGTCRSAARDCEDGNVCTDDSCSESSGGCVRLHNTGPCTDDGLVCTHDVCSAGLCTHRRVSCGVRMFCDEASGGCVPIDTM